jgi:hypothetical protein
MGADLLHHPPDPGEMESPATPGSVNGANSNRQLPSYTSASTGVQGQTAHAASSPSPEAVAACDEHLLDELWSVFQAIDSYTNSALEACRRGDRDEIRLRLRVQLRDCFRYAVELHNLLSPAPPKGGQP